MRKKKLIFFGMLLLLIGTPVYADTCSVTDKINLKKIAGFIDITYYPYDEGNETKFYLIISNSDKFYVKSDSDILVNADRNGNYNEIRISNLNPGQSYTFYFYAVESDCYGTEIYKKTISLPKYNKFYNDPVCNGKEEFYLCNKWKEHNLSYEEFVRNVNEYEKKEKEVIDVKKEDVKDFWSILLQIYLKYYWAILIPIIIILIIVIVFLRKKDDLIK